MVSYRQLRARCRAFGLMCDLDRDCQCYRATAPAGMRFTEGPHELIAVYGGGIIGNGQTQAEARADLYDRLDVPGELLEPCPDPDCDWCGGH